MHGIAALSSLVQWLGLAQGFGVAPIPTCLGDLSVSKATDRLTEETALKNVTGASMMEDVHSPQNGPLQE